MFQNRTTIKGVFGRIIGIVCICLWFGVLSWSCSGSTDKKEVEIADETTWKAPEEANHKVNPMEGSDAIEAGSALYMVYCWNCHGETGLGDGAAGGAMGSKPANFHTETFLNQTDGAIFWKISEGRGAMPGFEEVLGEEERWQLTTFVRQLGQMEITEPTDAPKPLVEGISVTQFAKVAPRATRVFYRESDHSLWYATFTGDVYTWSLDDAVAQPKKVVSVEDHGIDRLQGATIYGDTLLLTGNIRVNDNKGTTGWMMRVVLHPEGKHEVSKVFSTVEYGTTNTPFDHGWSAVKVSPDGKYVYVVSGSRTDHGEVQDNLGAYPDSRDEPLTARIFRFPIDAKDLSLPNDLEKLKEKGYVFAEGIRNAYDFDFDEEGRMFAVVNSGDYDQNEDMFWVREGHHYGFPWVMGGMETPQQFPDWEADPEKDPFLNPAAAAYPDDFYNDPGFAKRPEGVEFTQGMRNFGPDANKYRDEETGKIMDGSDTGVAITTFTPHSSPLGLVFDRGNNLPGQFKGNALTLRYTNGERSSLMKPFTSNGEDLLHLELSYNEALDNFDLKTTRIVARFSQPVDAVLVGNDLYVIEYGGRQKGGNLWKVTFEK
ncbi:c-type cytochrome [Pleomorphovibrio marinus]|uniref:c-type cytochrome n=1 Tax=Pleomorphovibrio marinus TaxID=2164132 RepID=UPI000E0A421A|nr:c-type cytochrome [Pleomorphovibrio marinus]